MVIFKRIVPVILFALAFTSCEPDENRFTINGNIKGAEGKYIKYINMLEHGHKSDSLYVDMGSKFILTKVSNEPVDLVFYFNNEESVRILAGVNETITLTANADNMLKSYKVEGSPESALLADILKKNAEVSHALDTMDMFYMKNQQHPNLDSIVVQLRYLSDSVYNTHKQYLHDFVKKNPSSLSSYIVLSLKLNRDIQYFKMPDDIEYFKMVDTAIYNRYDSIQISQMLHTYVAKMESANKSLAKSANLSIGDTVPDIILPNPYGDTLPLSALRGKYVLIDFWGSWCKPCRETNKGLLSVYYTFSKRGFQIYQVAIERNIDDWKNTIREDKLWWKYQVSDLQYMKSPVANQFGLKELPANFLIDGNGVIVAKNLYGEDLREKLKEVLPRPVVVKKDTVNGNTKNAD